MNFKDFFKRHNAYQDAIMERFVSQLQGILHSAQHSLTSDLLQRLKIEDGKIARLAGNAKVLRSVERLFAESLARTGYDSLVMEFVGSFNGQFKFMHEIMDWLGEQMKTPLTIAPEVLKAGASFQANAVVALEAVADTVAAGAARKALFSIGGLAFDELTGMLADRYAVAIPEATGLASTLQTTFFRTITDTQFQIIEAEQPGTLKYKYAGPDDKLTRPFCKRHVGKSYTRAQIDRMDNQMLPNVMTSMGGWRCRHQWILDVSSITFAQAA